MPQTRAEAMQILGVGVTPTASEVAIKKIVDGLRQSWHPDHAKDEADRAMRELRSKQINAAWELLRRQRAVV
jgi:DnaJ-class molecular chaperone